MYLERRLRLKSKWLRLTQLALFMIAILPASRLMAQAVSGTIVGTVVDQSGAVVANAPVDNCPHRTERRTRRCDK